MPLMNEEIEDISSETDIIFLKKEIHSLEYGL
jgi:hypothetical protein